MGSPRYPILFTLVSLSFLQGAQGRPKSHIGQLSKNTGNYPVAISEGRNSTEKPQRLCLARLRDALQLACGGSERAPVYFDPSQFMNITQGSSRIESSANPALKNFRNDISVMSSANQPRRLLRRRYRRNIVRECCHKPCSHHNLMKYCSTSIRFSSSFRGDPPSGSANKKQLLLGRHKNKESLLINQHPLLLQDDSRFISIDGLSTNRNNATKNNDHMMTIRSNNQNDPSDQCVTVADLQNFYETIVLHGIWKKDSNAGAFWDKSHSHKQNLHVEDFDAGVNAYAVATNEMHPGLTDFLNQIIALNRGNYVLSSQSTPTPTESAVEEILDDNENDNNVLEFEDVTEAETSTKPRHTSNIQTFKPRTFISLPKGTNDYFY